MPRLTLGPGAEFDRIRRIIDRLGAAAGPIGDDCAVLPAPTGVLTLSGDLSIEGIHFRREWLAPEEIGWRAAVATLSDLAAEGAEPLGVLASVGVPADAKDGALEAVMEGVGAAATGVGTTVLGGDLSRGPCWILDLTALGRTDRPVSRAGARRGDRVWVSGTLGGARAALVAWQSGTVPGREARAAFAHPEPRIRLGRALAAAGATAMVDLSDGLAGDAGHLAAASGVRLEIDLALLPLAPGIAELAGKSEEAPEEFAARGGEDYELLVTLPSAFDLAAAYTMGRDTGVPLTRVGTVVGGAGVHLRLRGRDVVLSGYDHFA